MKTNKNYIFLEIIIFFIFICLGGQTLLRQGFEGQALLRQGFEGQVVFASDSPPKTDEGIKINNPFMGQTNLPQVPFLDKNLKIGQIFDQLQKMIENQIKTLFRQNVQQSVQKEAKKEIVKQISLLEKDFLKNFYGIINNIKKPLENIKQYFQNTFKEIKWKILTPRY